MKDNRDKILTFILEEEGNKSTNIKEDHGGLTAAYGMTLDTMKKLGLDLNHDGRVDENDVPLVTKAVVDAAFDQLVWEPINGNYLPSRIDATTADLCYNSGIGKVREFETEGNCGPWERALVRRFKFYRYQVKSIKGQDKFAEGWYNRIISLFDFCLTLPKE